MVLLYIITVTFMLVTGEFSCFPSGITYTVLWARQKSLSSLTLTVLTTHAHLPISPWSFRSNSAYLSVDWKKQVTFYLVSKNNTNLQSINTQNRQQHLTVAASRGQACDNCGSEGNNREEVWKVLHFSVSLIVMRPISQRMAGYICKRGQLVPDLIPIFFARLCQFQRISSLILCCFNLTMRLLLEWTHWKCNGVTVRGGWWEGEGYNGPLWTQTQPVQPRAEWVCVKQSWQERSFIEMHWCCLNVTYNFHCLNHHLSKWFFFG